MLRLSENTENSYIEWRDDTGTDQVDQKFTYLKLSIEKSKLRVRKCSSFT